MNEGRSKDFIENILGAEGRARSVVIAARRMFLRLLRMQVPPMPRALPKIFAIVVSMCC